MRFEQIMSFLRRGFKVKRKMWRDINEDYIFMRDTNLYGGWIENLDIPIKLSSEEVLADDWDFILDKGTKLIFEEWGGVLSTNVGNVYTFERWYDESTMDHEDSYYRICMQSDFAKSEWKEGGSNYHKSWQASECMKNSLYHNFGIWEVAIFNPEIHKQFKMMDENNIEEDQKKFKERYGG